jgi:phosphoglycolate phosphatase
MMSDLTGARMQDGAIELVVFDWDGTLIDSTAALTDAMRMAAEDLGLPVPSRERASHVIGMGLRDALAYAMPTLPPARLAAFIERYRHHFMIRDALLQPFEGMVDLLDDLDALGVPLAIATGKSRAGLDRALEQMGWRSLFVDTRCADQGLPKPDPWMLRDLCESCSVEPARALMIGDTTHDLGMAAALGTPCVAVTYGAHPRDGLAAWSPAAMVDSVHELREWVWPRLAAARRDLPVGWHWRRVCTSSELVEGGAGIRFDHGPGRSAGRRSVAARPAFVVRHQGEPRAFLNECGHVPVELDWPQGQFFDDSGLYLSCATHGAMYRPADGSCAGGPCRGRGLSPLRTRESNGKVWVAFEILSP